MSLVRPQDVAFYSNFVTDKIVGVYSGSFDTDTAPTLGGYIAYTSFSHTFTRPVFTKLQVSSDQVNWKDENSGTVSAISYSTSSQIFILHNPLNGVIYYRLLAFWIDDYDSTNPSVPPTVGSLSKTYFDSRLNYQQVAMQGKLSVPAGALGYTNTVYHNLGYKPTVRVFNDMLPGQIWPSNYDGLGNYWMYDFTMIETEVKIWDDRVDITSTGSVSSPASSVWYIIYYDD